MSERAAPRARPGPPPLGCSVLARAAAPPPLRRELGRKCRRRDAVLLPRARPGPPPIRGASAALTGRPRRVRAACARPSRPRRVPAACAGSERSSVTLLRASSGGRGLEDFFMVDMETTEAQ
ncbi:hypothetical protein ACP70R_019732 [Stipagrostis hirtigluma subsp. patula]